MAPPSDLHCHHDGDDHEDEQHVDELGGRCHDGLGDGLEPGLERQDDEQPMGVMVSKETENAGPHNNNPIHTSTDARMGKW